MSIMRPVSYFTTRFKDDRKWPTDRLVPLEFPFSLLKIYVAAIYSSYLVDFIYIYIYIKFVPFPCFLHVDLIRIV